MRKNIICRRDIMKTKNNLYYVKTKLLVEYKIVAESLEQAIEEVKRIENVKEIVEVKLLEENVYIGV